MNDELTPSRAGGCFVSSFIIHHLPLVCAREQTHFGRTLDDVIIGNQITIVRDEKHRAGAAFWNQYGGLTHLQKFNAIQKFHRQPSAS
jgi:hypothetical protein